MDILEAITRKLQSHAAGYTPNYVLFKPLTAEEVEEYMKLTGATITWNGATVTLDETETPLDNIGVWHPVSRLKLMLHIAHSLHAQGEL